MADQEGGYTLDDGVPNQISVGLVETTSSRIISYMLDPTKVGDGTFCINEQDPDYLPLVGLRTRRFGEEYPYPAIQGYRSGNEVEVVCYMQDETKDLPPPARVISYMAPIVTEQTAYLIYGTEGTLTLDVPDDDSSGYKDQFLQDMEYREYTRSTSFDNITQLYQSGNDWSSYIIHTDNWNAHVDVDKTGPISGVVPQAFYDDIRIHCAFEYDKEKDYNTENKARTLNNLVKIINVGTQTLTGIIFCKVDYPDMDGNGADKVYQGISDKSIARQSTTSGNFVVYENDDSNIYPFHSGVSKSNQFEGDPQWIMSADSDIGQTEFPEQGALTSNSTGLAWEVGTLAPGETAYIQFYITCGKDKSSIVSDKHYRAKYKRYNDMFYSIGSGGTLGGWFTNNTRRGSGLGFNPPSSLGQFEPGDTKGGLEVLIGSGFFVQDAAMRANTNPQSQYELTGGCDMFADLSGVPENLLITDEGNGVIRAEQDSAWWGHADNATAYTSGKMHIVCTISPVVDGVILVTHDITNNTGFEWVDVGYLAWLEPIVDWFYVGAEPNGDSGVTSFSDTGTRFGNQVLPTITPRGAGGKIWKTRVMSGEGFSRHCHYSDTSLHLYAHDFYNTLPTMDWNVSPSFNHQEVGMLWRLSSHPHGVTKTFSYEITLLDN